MSDPVPEPNPTPDDTPPGDVVNLDDHRPTPGIPRQTVLPNGWTDEPSVYLPGPPAPAPAPASAAPAAPSLLKPTAPTAPSVPAPREDLAGDRPFLPGWIRTKAGRRTKLRASGRQLRRIVRRWWARQRTTRGHAAQAWRGIRRSHDWMVGLEGVHVRATAHQAHIAVREAHDLARRARFTLLPGDRAQAQKLSAAAQAVALAAVGAHKKAKSNRRQIRAVRFLVAYGIPVTVVLAAFVFLGVGGLLLGAAAVVAGEAILGRKPFRETVWDTDIRALSDGDPMTESMLDRAFKAAKIIGEGQRLTLVTPCAIDPAVPNAWHAVIDLPDVTVKRAKDRVDELAAAMGIDRTNMDLSQVGSNGRRLALWACGQDPFLATRRNPLIGTKAPVNTWRDGFPLAFDKRGRILRPTLSDYSFLFAGATRSGKGMGILNLLVGALLDPLVRIRVFDGKGAGDYVRFAPVLSTFVRRNPRRLVRFLRVMVNEMNRRTEILVDHGLSKANEKLLETLGGIELVIIDELATYTAKDGPGGRWAEEITELLAQLGAVGAAVGIVLGLATQYPDADIVTTRLRGNILARMAMRVESPSASNVILGDGMVGQGYDASKIPPLKTSRGRNWLTSPDTGTIETRSLFIDESNGEILPMIETGVRLREQAGYLPGQWEDPVEAAMVRVTGASAAAGGTDGRGDIVHHTVLDHMIQTVEASRELAISNADLFTQLAAIDPRYGRGAKEAENTWLSRAGKTLRNELVNLGVDITPERISAADGTRPNGYTLAALRKAAAKIEDDA
jgi:S-DNA-T family DNA segregation ATPase FtsK/SpoIIIE